MSPNHGAEALISVGNGGLSIDGQTVPLLSGALHYFRTPKAHWRDALLGMRDLGLRFVDIYTPWAIHEPERGTYDFGDLDERNDLTALLSLADSLEMRVLFRPGPHINAELTRFGIPRWIVDDEACTAQAPGGEPVPLLVPPIGFAVPSYASPIFHQAVARWFARLSQEVRPFMYPAGPVVLVQIDNEAAFYFRDSVYDQDYRPEAKQHYRAFIAQRYRDVKTFNAAHPKHAIDDFALLEPPVAFAAKDRRDLTRHLDWVESQEALLCDSLSGLAAELARCGLLSSALTTHNLPMGDGGQPLGPGALSHTVQLVGADYYERRQRLNVVKRRTLRLCGSVAFPFAAEAGVGGPPWLPARTAEDTLQTLLCGLAYGLRGVNLYMAVDRDRWYGAALDSRGERKPVGKRIGQLLSAIREVDFFKLRREVAVGLILPRTYQRLARATHTLGAVSPALLDISDIGAVAACRQERFGYNFIIQQHFAAWLQRAANLLDQAQIPYVYIDSDAHPDRLRGLQTIFAPTYELADPATIALVRTHLKRAGRVYCGPEKPLHDPQQRPVAFPTAGVSFLDLTDPRVQRALLTELERQPELHPGFDVEGAAIERTVHGDQQGPQVLFLTNFTDNSAEARVQLPSPMRLLDVISGTTYQGKTQAVITVKGRTCLMLRIRPPRTDTGSETVFPSGADHAE